jgi:hypothetical protein
MAETQKEKLMRILNVTAEEAEEIIAYDKAVDQGKKTPYDITSEQEKQTRKYRQADRKPTVYDFTKKRERKPNATKGGLIAELFDFLSKNSQFSTENVTITNKERQIAFQIGEDKFELTLVQKRKPKK